MKSNRITDLINSEKRLLKKKKMLLQMKKQINKLEFDINHPKSRIIKNEISKGLSVALYISKAVLPCALVLLLTFGSFFSIGITPFIRDDRKKKLETKKEFDSFGNIRYEEQYDRFNDSTGTISHFEKWKEEENGFYSRKVSTYLIDRIDEDVIIEMVNKNNINSLDDLFSIPAIVRIERKNNLTLEEVSLPPHLEAVFYSKDDENFIIVKESIGENIGFSAIWILLTILCELIPVFKCGEKMKELAKYIDSLDDKYIVEKKDDLVKILDIKRNNYNLLTR